MVVVHLDECGYAKLSLTHAKNGYVKTLLHLFHLREMVIDLQDHIRKYFPFFSHRKASSIISSRYVLMEDGLL